MVQQAMKPCAHCAADFLPATPNAKYCPECRVPGKGGLKTRYRADKVHGPKVCATCSVEFYTKHKGAAYCSRKCGFASSKRTNPPRVRASLAMDDIRILRRWGKMKRRLSKGDRLRAKRQRRLQMIEALSERIPCRECGASFAPVPATKVFCSEACSNKDHRRTAKKRYKARLRGVKVEPVNPTLVFQRDRWMCQLCGKPTLKSARGTCNPRAPELDHIQPLSKGGEHSYRNTQCTCRACNHAKSDAELGQLRMFGGIA